MSKNIKTHFLKPTHVRIHSISSTLTMSLTLANTSLILSKSKTHVIIPPTLTLRTLSLNLNPSLSSFTISSSTKPLKATPQPKYVYPDPIPEFAESETQKFRRELIQKLSKTKETFGDEIDDVVTICTEIFSEFLHKEYGGPGTLLVEPFTDMLVSLKEKKLPGAPVAARAALLWAQNYVDRDWEIWTNQSTK